MTTANDTGMSRIPESGATVFTRDGALLGHVAQTVNGFFKVDPRSGGEYWLSAEFVLSSNPAQVELDFDAERLDDYKLEKPGPTLTGSPMLDEEADTFANAEEKRQRREAMERGYGRH